MNVLTLRLSELTLGVVVDLDTLEDTICLCVARTISGSCPLWQTTCDVTLGADRRDGEDEDNPSGHVSLGCLLTRRQW